MSIDLIILVTMHCFLLNNLSDSVEYFYYVCATQDGVRLGCYGHEVHGKQYMTQYVADAKGYRLVGSEDLITVYPKYGKPEG